MTGVDSGLSANREFLLSLFEERLHRRLPGAYRELLLDRGSAVVDGFHILGLPADHMGTSVLQGFELLREKRSDSPATLVPVIMVDTSACCLDLAEATDDDAPLVELDLENSDPPQPVGQTFSQWIAHHENTERRFARGWARVRNRQAEAGGRGRIQDWSAPIFRVRDYIIGIAAFRFSHRLGCLEADEFLPVEQPHLRGGEAVKILLSEALSRARDYTGSLRIQFTRDIREDEDGRIDADLDMRRVPSPIPGELLTLAARYSVKLPDPERGTIAHEDAVNLWFASLELPEEAAERVMQLEKAGWLRREIIAEVISLGFWTKEEAVWILLNAPRPEAVILGTDSVEDRPSYVESLHYARAAVIATNLRYAIIAAMNEGFTMEEIEEVKTNCVIEPTRDFWYLTCDAEFGFPELWLMGDSPRTVFQPHQPILLLCRPGIPGCKEVEMERLRQYLDMLVSAREQTQAKCLVLSNEHASPYYCKFVSDVEGFVRCAEEQGVSVVFAPTRIDLFLDQTIHARMQKIRSMTKLPQRQGPKSLQLFEVPDECWQVPSDSRASRAIQNAYRSALSFAQQLVKKRDVARYQSEFSLMCEVIEREASQNHRFIGELDEEDSLSVLNALRHTEGESADVSLPFVAPPDMGEFLCRLEDDNDRVASLLRSVKGGIVLLTKPWQSTYLPPRPRPSASDWAVLELPSSLLEEIDKAICAKRACRLYACHPEEIIRAHTALRQSLAEGRPFPVASVRAHIFAEMVIDYIHETPHAPATMIHIMYNDGTQGEPFPLFALPLIKEPNAEELFVYRVGLVSLRHQESDKHLDRSLIRNREIQNRRNGAYQEELAFRRATECIDELLRYIRGELTERSDLSPSLRVLLGYRTELHERHWRGLHLELFHTTGLESAAIGTYRAILAILQKHQGDILVTPRILTPEGSFKEAERWF